MIASHEALISKICQDGAQDWDAVIDALEDGHYLKSIGIKDQFHVEMAYDYASEMAMSNPHIKPH